MPVAPASGRGLEYFAHFESLQEGTVTAVGATGLHIQPLRSQHSELCYGFVLYAGASPPCRTISCTACHAAGITAEAAAEVATTSSPSQQPSNRCGHHAARSSQVSSRLVPLLGWSADSGCSEELYAQLAVAPVLLLDARSKGSYEHAGFDELAALLLPAGGEGTAAGDELPASSTSTNGSSPGAEVQQAGAEAAGGKDSNASEAAGLSGLQRHGVGGNLCVLPGAQGGPGGAGSRAGEGEGLAAARQTDGEGGVAGGAAAAPPADVFARCRQVLLTGYGRQAEAPSQEWLQQQGTALAGGGRQGSQQLLQVARPGMHVKLM